MWRFWEKNNIPGRFYVLERAIASEKPRSTHTDKKAHIFVVPRYQNTQAKYLRERGTIRWGADGSLTGVARTNISLHPDDLQNIRNITTIERKAFLCSCSFVDVGHASLSYLVGSSQICVTKSWAAPRYGLQQILRKFWAAYHDEELAQNVTRNMTSKALVRATRPRLRAPVLRRLKKHRKHTRWSVSQFLTWSGWPSLVCRYVHLFGPKRATFTVGWICSNQF